jgi:hypothetical protein
MDSTASEHMDQASVTQCDIGECIIITLSGLQPESGWSSFI